MNSLIPILTGLLITLGVGFPLIGFWAWMFRDMLKNEYLPSESKSNWMVMFLLLNVFGALWYYLVEYRNRYL